jgi:hypothetical protein
MELASSDGRNATARGISSGSNSFGRTRRLNAFHVLSIFQHALSVGVLLVATATSLARAILLRSKKVPSLRERTEAASFGGEKIQMEFYMQ